MKHSGKIGKLKDENNHVLDNKADNFQIKLQNNDLDHEKKLTNIMYLFHLQMN